MKIPQTKPHSNAFMVFAMLLLGVFFAALVVIFDYWFGVASRSLSYALVNRQEVPLAWFAIVGALALTASGFFFYLLSFFLIAAPAFGVRAVLIARVRPELDHFSLMGKRILELNNPSSVPTPEDRRFKDVFLYTLLISEESPTASTLRFSFTQLMYARSVGAVLVAFAAYISWVLSVAPAVAVVVCSSVWLFMVMIYAKGLSYFESIMMSAALVQGRLTHAEPSKLVKPTGRTRQKRSVPGEEA